MTQVSRCTESPRACGRPGPRRGGGGGAPPGVRLASCVISLARADAGNLSSGTEDDTRRRYSDDDGEATDYDTGAWRVS
jgi:hypothetical protein